MTPPISIDGTDVSGITIDGQDVTEVTVDGQAVWNAIPDSGLTLRLKSEELTSSYNDGETVSTWEDISGNNNDFTSTGNPSLQTGELNAKAVVRYDGVDEYHTGPSLFSGTDERTVIAVLGAASGGMAVHQGGGSGTNNWFGFSDKQSESPADTRANLYDNDFDFNVQKDAPYYGLMGYDGSTVHTSKDDQDGQSVSQSLSTNSSEFWIGARNNAGTADTYFDGDIAEVLVYNRWLSATERQDVINYVTSEYGL